MLYLDELSNIKVLESEIGNEYEGLCGTEKGVLWEDSLEQFFIDNEIDVVSSTDEYIILKQKDKVVKFRLFMGNEGSSYISEHIDFNSVEG